MTAIIFDLDGTLVDSAPDIQAAANRMLEGEGAEPLDLPTVIGFIGNGLPKLVERAMGARDLPMDRHTELTARTLAFYNAESTARTLPYPGLVAALDALRAQGFALGICTNKPAAPARDILDQFDLARHFEVVIGGDTLPVKKPDPAPLRAAFDALARGGLYVGDSEVDAETAERAGVPFLLFTEGYRKQPVEALPHLARFDHFDALPGLVAQALARAAG
ncbi:phosphoglycolate phosphatase [Antarcticimicrobium luteum]|uniref:Phosphoglycolate phosphatase n=1 Tax=Antarcticimicrobium luteum TaxID=2547397 RepID=A0A4R5UWQ5_9RHOB|nr:phosphoglycolate phosphatase [Antarcticimicrobium luteum]TDK43730.1 phosphoglycolate phosphatase [Antarcticimicrobium luteum]